MNTPFPEDNVTAGYQEWRRLLFLHWRVPVEDVQRLLPRGLEVDEFDGSAWLGVVPFSMERIRPWWSPAVPGISWFLETNVRTYVVDRQGVRGVWFFSLDADQWLAVKIARRFWYLPYRHAVLSLQQSGGGQPQFSSGPDGGLSAGMNAESRRESEDEIIRVNYRGTRSEKPSADYEISVGVEPRQPAPAVTNTLEYFLVERYRLFAACPDGTLMTGRVHHDPYLLRPVKSCKVRQSLTAAAGFSVDDSAPPDHAAYSDGVTVRVSPLRRLDRSGSRG